MPYLSVCVPTMRVGGLDILFHGLKGQTYKDFEVIVADGVRQVKEPKSDGFGVSVDPSWKKAMAYANGTFPVLAPPVEPNPFPVNSFCKYANTALDAAQGEVVVFLTDYTWLPPDCLEKHAAFHRAHGPNEGYMAPHQYVACPPLHPDFPAYKPGVGDDTELYAADVVSGRLDRFGWSIFAEPFDQDPRTMPLCPNQGQADPKLGLPPGPVDRHMFHGKNESCKASVAKAVRWNEALDGTHGWQDSDMADALALPWTLDPENLAYIVNPRNHFPTARRLRDIWTNEALWKAGR
jgi:hypothetical protein